MVWNEQIKILIWRESKLKIKKISRQRTNHLIKTIYSYFIYISIETLLNLAFLIKRHFLKIRKILIKYNLYQILIPEVRAGSDFSLSHMRCLLWGPVEWRWRKMKPRPVQTDGTPLERCHWLSCRSGSNDMLQSTGRKCSVYISIL